MKELTLRDYYGRIIGYIETKPNGDKVARDFYKRIVGYYKKSIDATTDFYGRIVGRGDIVSSLIFNPSNKGGK